MSLLAANDILDKVSKSNIAPIIIHPSFPRIIIITSSKQYLYRVGAKGGGEGFSPLLN
jgi:hypothetical protein